MGLSGDGIVYLLSGFFDYDPGGPVERPPRLYGFQDRRGELYPALIRAGLPASVPGLQAVPDLFSQIASEVLIARPQMILIAHHTHRPFPRFQGGISCTAPHPHQVLIV